MGTHPAEEIDMRIVRRLPTTTALLATLLATPAQAQETPEQQSGSPWKTAAYYVPNRLLDVVDVFKLNASGGLGTGADLRLTRLLEVGFSEYDVVRVGLNGRRFPVYREKLSESSLSLLGITSGMMSRDPYEVGATLHFLVGGVEAGLNVRSLLDLLGGFFLLDLEDDDWGKDGRQ